MLPSSEAKQEREADVKMCFGWHMSIEDALAPPLLFSRFKSEEQKKSAASKACLSPVGNERQQHEFSIINVHHTRKETTHHVF